MKNTVNIIYYMYRFFLIITDERTLIYYKKKYFSHVTICQKQSYPALPEPFFLHTQAFIFSFSLKYVIIRYQSVG